MAMALFSWQVTQAVFESWETAMNSGSRSWATVAPGPKIRTLGSSGDWLNGRKPAVRTFDWSRFFTPPLRSMMLTVPSGSMV